MKYYEPAYIFVDRIVNINKHTFSGVELNINLKSWEHSFPDVMFIGGTQQRVEINFIHSDDNFKLTTGPRRTRTLVGGIPTKDRSVAEEDIRKIENRFDFKLTIKEIPSIPFFLTKENSKCIGRSSTALLHLDCRVDDIPHIRRMRTENQEANFKLVEYIGERVGRELSQVFSSTNNSEAITALSANNYSDLTLPVVMRNESSDVFAAIKIKSLIGEKQIISTVYPYDASVKIEIGTKLFLSYAGKSKVKPDECLGEVVEIFENS